MHLRRQLDHRVNFLVGLLAFLAHLFECVVHAVLAAHVRIDKLLFDGKACLDTLLARPVLAMRLALDENHLVIHATVPTQADSLGTFCLFETSQVEFEVLIVVVDRCNGTVFRLIFLLCVEHEYRQMFQDEQLQWHDIIWMHPVLGRLTHERTLRATSTGIAFHRIASCVNDIEHPR